MAAVPRLPEPSQLSLEEGSGGEEVEGHGDEGKSRILGKIECGSYEEENTDRFECMP